MSFGYSREQRVSLNDSAILSATLYSQDDETLVPEVDITSVTFTIVKPSDDPSTPSVEADEGDIVGDGEASYQVSAAVNDEVGEYKAYAQFTYDEGDYGDLKKSIVCSYEVYDPFVRAAVSPASGPIDAAWLKIEDCFDSEMGGPWLRDMTMNVFDKTKVAGLIPEALLEINQQMPFTDYNVDTFPYELGDSGAIMAQALLLSIIRHLMRSYTEQPDVTGSPVAFMDRKRYQAAWKAVYDVELERFKHWLNRWKLRSYDMDHAAILLGTKAGRMLPAPFRSRNVGRGF